MLSPFIFAVVVDVGTELAIWGALSELLYADDLVQMSEIIQRLREKSLKWKEAFESKVLKINLWKIKVIVSCSITKDGLSERKIDPCGACSLEVRDNSVLCIHCGRWIHGRCAGIKRVTPKF